MKTLKRECKSSLALALVIMLVMSMMMGVFTLSASADASDPPEQKSDAVMLYRTQVDEQYTIGRSSGSSIGYGVTNLIDDVCVYIDDTECYGTGHDLDHITSVTYTYEDSSLGISITGNLTSNYRYVSDFNTMLFYINPYVEFFRQYKNDSKFWDSRRAYDNISANDIQTFVDSVARADINITIQYEDGLTQTIPVLAYEQDGNTRIVWPQTTRSVLLRLAHSTTIDDKSFYRLENAIAYGESVNNNTTNRYYVDIDSDENVVLPMNNMSQHAHLVQTRIGDDIVYNTENSYDFGANSIDAVSDGTADIDRVFTVNSSYYASEEYLGKVASELYYGHRYNPQTGTVVSESGKRYVQVGNQLYYYTDWLKLGTDLIDKASVVSFTGEYRYLDGNLRSTYSSGDYGPKTFYISFTNPGTGTTNLNFVNKLKDYLENGSNSSWMQNLPSLTVGIKSQDGRYSTTYSYLSSVVNALTNNSTYKNGYITYLQFNTAKSMPDSNDYADFDDLVNFIESCGVDINNSTSYKPDNVATVEIPVTDYLNITETTGTARTKLEWADVYGIAGEAYEAVESTAPIMEDTLNGENIEVSIEKDLKSVKKGVVYNVVNQVTVYGETGMNIGYGWLDSDGKYYSYLNSFDRYSENDIGSANVFYMNGEFVRNYYSKTNYSDKAARTTEYKWGEIIFASRPDPVVDLAYDSETKELTWTKPTDEGFGTEKVNDKETTKVDPDGTVYVKTYTISVVDEDGNETYKTTITRDKTSDDVKFTVPDSAIGDPEKVHTLVVVATNVIGDSDEREVTYYIPKPAVEITMTPDKPLYRDTETVVYTETVTNKGTVKLTDVTVNQELMGEYDPQEGLTSRGTTAYLPDLEPGESYTFTYRVPASLAEDNKLVNDADVTTAQKVTDDDTCTVYTVNPYMTLTKTVDSDVYRTTDTITFTDTITNTGDNTLYNIVVTEDYTTGKFVKVDADKVDETENSNVVVIKELAPGESITLTYTVKAEDVDEGDNRVLVSVTTADATSEENVKAEANVRFRIIHPEIQVTTTTDKQVYNDLEDIVFTDVVTNTGDCTLTNVVVKENFDKGAYTDTANGTLNSDGTVTIAKLEPGESVKLQYTINAADAPVTNGTVTNLVTATADEGVSDDDSTTVKIVHYSIEVTKVVDARIHSVDDSVVFTNIVTNNGSSRLTNIVVEEDLPGTFQLANGAAIMNDNIVIAALEPGESYTYNYIVPANNTTIVDGRITGTVTATASENNLDDSSDKVSDSDTDYTLVQSPAISVTKTVDDRTYAIGETVVWTDTVTNTGDMLLTNVVVTESLNGTFDTSFDTTDNSFVIPTLEAGESVTFTFSTVITDKDYADKVQNCTVDAVAAEGVSDDATAEVPVNGAAIKVVKSVTKTEYTTDETIIYTDVITNTGDVTLTQVVVKEDLPGTFVEYDSKYKADGDTLIIDKIEIGQSIVVKYAVNVADVDYTDLTINSIVTATAKENVTDDDSQIVTVIIPEPEIENSDVDEPVIDEPVTDAESDIPTETEPETETEITTEAPAVVEKESDTPTETETEIESDIPTETETEIESDVPTETEIETETESDVPTETETETETESDVPTETETETESDVPTETDIETETETESDVPTEADTETEPDTETDTSKISGVDTERDADTKDANITNSDNSDIDSDTSNTKVADGTTTNSDTSSTDSETTNTSSTASTTNNTTNNTTTTSTTKTVPVAAGGSTESTNPVKTGDATNAVGIAVFMLMTMVCITVLYRKRED